MEESKTKVTIKRGSSNCNQNNHGKVTLRNPGTRSGKGTPSLPPCGQHGYHWLLGEAEAPGDLGGKVQVLSGACLAVPQCASQLVEHHRRIKVRMHTHRGLKKQKSSASLVSRHCYSCDHCAQ